MDKANGRVAPCPYSCPALHVQLDKVRCYVKVKPGERPSHLPLRQPGLQHKKGLVEEEDGSFDEVLDVLGKSGRNIETFESTQNGVVCREVGLNKCQRGS